MSERSDHLKVVSTTNELVFFTCNLVSGSVYVKLITGKIISYSYTTLLLQVALTISV